MAFLELKNVSYSYPRQSPVLQEVDLTLEKQQITAILGPNGSGKTTLSKLLVGIIRADCGEILLEGSSLKKYSLAEVGRRIGYIFQNPGQQLFCLTVEEEIGFGLRRQQRPEAQIKATVDYFLEYFELTPYRHTYPLYLSQGEKQRLAIAAVLANEPEFLILDEPTAGLDAYRKRRLADYLLKIARGGRGMALISHDEGFIHTIAERLVWLENGRIQSERRVRKNSRES